MSKKTEFDDLLKKQDTGSRGSDQKHQILENIVKSNDDIPVISISSSNDSSTSESITDVTSKTNIDYGGEIELSTDVALDSSHKTAPAEVIQLSIEKKEASKLDVSRDQIDKDVVDTKATAETTLNAYSYLENYLRESARGLISVKNGRVIKTKKTDTYEHTTVYLDKNLASRLAKFLKQGGLDKSPFINVAISYFLDQLEKPNEHANTPE